LIVAPSFCLGMAVMLGAVIIEMAVSVVKLGHLILCLWMCPQILLGEDGKIRQVNIPVAVQIGIGRTVFARVDLLPD
jgi:hypothetical protein